MEPNSKKRRLLAPKVDETTQEQLPYQQRFESGGYPAALMGDAPTSQSLTSPTDFEQFAKNLRAAASSAQAQPSENKFHYTSVTVFLVRWEDDLGVESDLLALEKLFKERYNYNTETWTIPSGPDANAKLSLQIAKHIENSEPDNLLIIYYAGYAFIGSDQSLYWACNSREDASNLKWENVQTVIEHAQPDVLLLLDACAIPDGAATGSNGIKQAIAACGRENVHEEHSGPTFTYNLIDALHNLSSGLPFTVHHLHEELVTMRHQRSMDNSTITNGNGEVVVPAENTPVLFSLNPGTIILAPLAPIANGTDFDPTNNNAHGSIVNENLFLNGAPPELVFDELRALVSLSFMGEPNEEIESFKAWMDSIPTAGRKVAVEAMFHGPPTIIMLSMPISVWNTIQPDRVCSFLGYIKSHNMFRQHQDLSDVSTARGSNASRHLQDGKMLLEAREAAASSPGLTRHSPQHAPNMIYPPVPQAGNMVDHTIVDGPRKDDVEDSDEMHEAAIQLKALSHVRPPGRDDHLHGVRSHSQVKDEAGGFRGPREGSQSSHGPYEGGDGMYPSEFNTPAVKPKARRTVQKSTTKQEIQCTLCTHAPFKDSSSLRKHIAAAHTRPFPCAFSFAGCPSTFGSKNEWKRHIASQHLCLTYYRCSSCPKTNVEGKGNEFNRKDLFTQHLRRMHAPFAIKKGLPKVDAKLVAEWDDHIKEMQKSCLITRRQPPQRSACPKPDCSNVFEGVGSWDDWTEHVGRHMEKGEASRLGVDTQFLARWALDEGIIERTEDGEYKLCGQDRESQANGYYSDGVSRNQMDDSGMQDQSMMDHAIDHMLEDGGTSQSNNSGKKLPERSDSTMYSMW